MSKVADREDVQFDDARIESLKKDLIESGVQYAMGSYADVHGVPKAKVVPIEAFDRMVRGSELYTVGGMEGMGPLGPHEDECSAIPDLESLVVFPWDRRYAWMASVLDFHGSTYEYCSRSILLRVREELRGLGFDAMLGFEPEFYVLRDTPDGVRPYHPNDTRYPTNAYDVEGSLDSMPVLDEMVRCLQELGWGVVSFDHEGGHGQYELDFGYADIITQTDRFVFFRLMAKEIAKRFGAFASFMPKPFAEDFGSGAHFNMSLFKSGTDENTFADPDDPSGRGFSRVAYHFVAGVLRHSAAITAVSCPTVNSYKRLIPVGHMYDVTWAPAHMGWGYNNRTLMLRLPMNRSALENRAVDLTCNPYLAAAMHFAAGAEGIRKELEPPAALWENAYQSSSDVLADHQISMLPRNLSEALNAFEEDELAEEVFGTKFKEHFLSYKRTEWDEYHASISEWERERYMRYF